MLSLRSQFFHNRRHFSSHAKLRSTTHRLGMTLKVNKFQEAVSEIKADRAAGPDAPIPVAPSLTRGHGRGEIRVLCMIFSANPSRSPLVRGEVMICFPVLAFIAFKTTRLLEPIVFQW